jgi:hypothetical protein
MYDSTSYYDLDSYAYDDGRDFERQNTDMSQTRTRIIKRAAIRTETEHFDHDEGVINDVIFIHGGYTEGADVNFRAGRNTDYKTGSYTFRVPSENFDEIIDTLRNIGKLISVSISSEDVTNSYRHTDTELAAKLVEEERVLDIMRRAETVAELLQLERRLSEIRKDIELLRSRLNTIDSLADYSTIKLTLTEVESIDDGKPSVFARMANSFNGSVRFMGEFIALVMVAAAALSVPFGFFAVVVIFTLIIVQSSRKLNRALKDRRGNKKISNEEL